MTAFTTAAKVAASKARAEAADIKIGTVTAVAAGGVRASVSVAGGVVADVPVVKSARTGLAVGNTVLVAFSRPQAWVIGVL